MKIQKIGDLFSKKFTAVKLLLGLCNRINRAAEKQINTGGKGPDPKITSIPDLILTIQYKINWSFSVGIRKNQLQSTN
jgi:hypothetical protein